MLPKEFKGDALPNIPDYQKLLDAVVEASEVGAGIKILDYGARTGALTIRLLEKEANCKITAIVFPLPETANIESAKMRTIGEKIEMWSQYFRQHLEKSGHKDKVKILDDISFFNLGEQNQFDLVVSSYALHHFSDNEKTNVLRKIYDLLKPKGKFIFNERFFRFTDDMSSKERLRVVLEKFARVAPTVMEHCGEDVAMRLFDNYRATHLKDGEYPLSLDGYFKLCRDVGFKVDIYKVDWLYDNVLLKCEK